MRSSSESLNQNSLNLIGIDSLDSLEQLTDRARLQKSRTLGKWVEAVLNRLGSAPEPRVWQRSDRAGHITWHAYDPASNLSATFSSEDEVRGWLEERYRL
ncbi:MAG: hypothetical protein SNJ57_08890 [Cyanobacteriota bacterium]